MTEIVIVAGVLVVLCVGGALYWRSVLRKRQRKAENKEFPDDIYPMW